MSTSTFSEVREIDGGFYVIGARLRQLRESRGMTVVELADRTGLSEKAIERAENGVSAFNLAAINLLATALGQTVKGFLHLDYEIDLALTTGDPHWEQYVPSAGGRRAGDAGTRVAA